MKRIRNILYFVLALSLIFPTVYLYYLLFPKRIIDSEYAIALLGKEIVKQGEEKGLKGYVTAVKTITGDKDAEIEKLKKEINFTLGAYKGWNVVVSSEELKTVLETKEEDLKKKSILVEFGLFNADTYARLCIENEKIVVSYDALCSWQFLPGNRENCKISLQVIRRSDNVPVVDCKPQKMTHPIFFATYEKRRRIAKYGCILSASTFLVSLTSFLLLLWIWEIKRQRLVKSLDLKVGEIERMVSHGSYVAANRGLDRYLEYLPHDEHLDAIKSRIDIITKGNPKLAETAFVKFLQFRELIRKSFLLSPTQHQELLELPKFLSLPELDGLIAEYGPLERIRILSDKFYKKLENCKKMYEEGRPVSTREEIEKIHKDEEWQELGVILSRTNISITPQLSLPAPEIIGRLLGEAEEKIKVSKRCLEEAEYALSRFDVSEAERNLQEALRLNKELTEAQELLNRINKSRDAGNLKLIPENVVGKEVWIFKKDTITFGRNPQLDICLDNSKVSREPFHLKISVLQNEVIVQDPGSTNGTFVHGERIRTAQLENGDIIDIARRYRLVVHIYKESAETFRTTQATVTAGEGIDHGLLPEGESSRRVTGIFLEGDDKSYIVGDVFVNFAAVGILPEVTSEFRFLVRNEVILFAYPSGVRIIFRGEVLEHRGVRYRVEKL